MRHEEAKLGLPSDVPEDIEEYVYFFFFHSTKTRVTNSRFRARQSLGCVVQPLIDGIRMYTKTCVTILVGSPPSEVGGNYFVKVLNSGATTDSQTPKDFHDWDKEGFKTNVVQHFICFLSHTSASSASSGVY